MHKIIKQSLTKFLSRRKETGLEKILGYSSRLHLTRKAFERSRANGLNNNCSRDKSRRSNLNKLSPFLSKIPNPFYSKPNFVHDLTSLAVSPVVEMSHSGNEKLSFEQQVKPSLSMETVGRLARDLYGFRVNKIRELDSYADKNFKLSVEEVVENDHITGISRDGYVFKMFNSLDSKNPDFIDAQIAIMQHLNNNGICTNSVVPQKTGKLRSYSSLRPFDNSYYSVDMKGEHLVFVLEYVPGIMLKGLPYTPYLMHSVGDFLGRMRKVLETFSNPGYEYAGTAWNLASVPDCRELVFAVNNVEDRRLVLDVIADFEDQVLKSSDSFRRGYVHQDFNGGNLVVQPSATRPGDYDMSGVIDFGDSHYGCIIYDLSVCLTYMMLESNILPPVECAGHVLAGFLQHVSLSQEEKDVIRTCILARMAQSLTMGIYSYKTQAEENEYLLQTSTKWPLLRKFRDTSSDEMNATWRRVLAGYGLEW